FAGLGALSDLDVELVGEGAVLGGHAEATRRDLLDAAVLVALLLAPGPEAIPRLAPLTAVGPATDEVHGLGQRLVGLAAEGAVGHGAGREPGGYGQGGLDLLERDGRPGWHQVEQVAHLGGRAFVHHGGELVVQLVAAVL